MESNYNLGRLVCPNCQIVIRPPYTTCSSAHLVCPHCKKHTDSTAKIKNKVKKCKSKAVKLSFLDVIFKDIIDNCQYNCGYRGKILSLRRHESSCLKEEEKKVINCVMESCDWCGDLKNLGHHVNKVHPNCFVELSDIPDEGFMVDFDNPTLLINQFNTDSDINELYCLRLCKNSDNRYAMIQYIGHTGPEIDDHQKLNAFTIVEYDSKYKMMGEICKIESTNFDDIVTNGVKLKSIKEHKYLVKMKNCKVNGSEKKMMSKTFKCKICAKAIKVTSSCDKSIKRCAKCTKQLDIFSNSLINKSTNNVSEKTTRTCKKDVEKDISNEIQIDIKDEQFDDFSDNISVIDFVEAHCVKDDITENLISISQPHGSNTTDININQDTEISVTSSKNYRRFICDKCGKIFNNPGNLRVHLRIHSSVRRLKCTQCSKTFNDTSNLKRHLLIHSGEKPFSCHVCGKSFTELGTLTRHIRIHTGDKPYSCQQCGRAFSVACSLTRHLRIHAGIRPFNCTVCTKAFSRSSHLKAHMRVHNRVQCL